MHCTFYGCYDTFAQRYHQGNHIELYQYQAVKEQLVIVYQKNHKDYHKKRVSHKSCITNLV